jgi:F-type H+-transporting ATPase subunit c
MDVESLKEIMPGLTMMVGGMFPSLAIGWMGAHAMDAIGRNPEAAGKLQTILILVVAFAEAIAIYSLVIALILKFV